jgi:hypothetical protein
LWFVVGVVFAVAVKFVPGEGHAATRPEWVYSLSESLGAIITAPIEIAIGLAFASGGLLFVPGILYIGVHAYFTLSARRRSVILILCCLHLVVASIAVIALFRTVMSPD